MLLAFVKYGVFDFPHKNGITLFFMGAIFLLSVYHFILYFQSKDKTYLFYSLYTTLLFVRSLHEPQNCFLNELEFLEPILNTTKYFSTNLEWAYNTVYFIFAFTFINLKQYSVKWYKFIFTAVAVLLTLNVFVEILHLTTNIKRIYSVFRYVFIALLLILSIIGYIPLFRIKGVLKYYIIVGSLFFLIFSIVAFLVSRYGWLSKGTHINVSIFYIGAIIENLCFALGLGHRQKLILKDKNKTQLNFINQLQENEKLRIVINKKLELDVKKLSEKAKKEKFENQIATYEKQLLDHKMDSLRSQMNPHFIFNSLNAIKLYIIENKKENAVYYLNKFSKLIRKILATTRETEITLADEIETLKLYLDIENIRFNNEIKIKIVIAKNLNINTIKVPPLILQPFIENAIWHGLSSKKKSKKIELVFEKVKQKYLKITIIDNGIGRQKANEIKRKKIYNKESIGIKLTKERLMNFSKSFKAKHKIKFIDLYHNEIAKGTKVIIKIPI